MTTVKVKVTAEDIRGGQRGSIRLCPVALALSREVGRRCLVGGHYIYLGDNLFSPNVPSPAEVRSFVGEYDCGGKPTPFEFDLEVP